MSPRLWYVDPFVSYTTRIGPTRKLTARRNVRNALNRRELLAASITSSTSNRVDLTDPRVAYYGWSDANELPTVFQLQDPREVSFSVSLEF